MKNCQCGGSPHTVDCMYQHFLSYTSFTDSKELKMAYAHGCSVSDCDQLDARRYRFLASKVAIIGVTGLVNQWHKFEFMNMPFPKNCASNAAVELSEVIDAELGGV